MVHARDAAGAVPAVVRAGGFGGVALFTPSCVLLRSSFVLCNILLFRFCGARWELVSARIDGAGLVVGKPEADEEGVEGYGFAAGERTGSEVGTGVEEVLRVVAEEGDETADGGDGEALEAFGGRAGLDVGHLDIVFGVFWAVLRISVVRSTASSAVVREQMSGGISHLRL